MPTQKGKIYNFSTKFKHKTLRCPIRLRAVHDLYVQPSQKGSNRAVKTKAKILDLYSKSRPRLTIVFLHGISATAKTWSLTIRQFAQNSDLASCRLIALDLLGFGKTLQADWLDYDYHDYDLALNNALKKLKVTGPVVLVGHSMGSLIAADYTTNFHPDFDIVALILVSPPVLMSGELAKLPDRVYTKSYSSLQKLVKDEPALEVVANIIQRFTSFNGRYIKTPAFAKSMEQVILNRHNYQTYTKIRIPTLIIHGRFDPLVMPSNLKRAVKANPTHLRFVSVMGHHDISAAKRTKILIELKRILREQNV